jgi:hypothetical protein
MSKPLYKVRLRLIDKVSWDSPYDWLCENDLQHHYVNAYFNKPSDVVVVLTDCNTAIMLKLALA